MNGEKSELKPCPFCGNKGELVSGCGEYWVKCRACDAATKMMNREADAAVWWNKRSDERTEFGQILAGMKARGMITQADVDRLERGGLKEVPHAG